MVTVNGKSVESFEIISNIIYLALKLVGFPFSDLLLEDLAALVISISIENYFAGMPSLPQGAFAACKIREQMPSDSDENGPKVNSSKRVFQLSARFLENSPVKYNGKFMNAIWGLYNRYSPHNIKSNDAASTTNNILPTAVQRQQQ